MEETGGRISPLRRKRLIILASRPHHHKPYYHQYYQLMQENPAPVGWLLGMAFLTPSGEEELQDLRRMKCSNA